MNSKTRNRLIGSITILLLIVIFFPYMVKDKAPQPESTIAIIDSEVLQQDIVVDDIHALTDSASDAGDETIAPPQITTDHHDADIQVTVPDIVTNVESENRAAQIETDKVYNIQLVALKNRQKIEELVALLRLHNYDVYTDPSVPQDNQITRLLVGPYSSKEQAELIILDLKNLTKLNGFITSR